MVQPPRTTRTVAVRRAPSRRRDGAARKGAERAERLRRTMADTQHPRDEDGRNGRDPRLEADAAAETAAPAAESFVTTSGLSVVGEGRYRLVSRLGRGGMAEV